MCVLLLRHLYSKSAECVCIPTPRGCNLARIEIVRVITTYFRRIEKYITNV